MQKGSTLFLKSVIYLIGSAVFALCVSALYMAIFSGTAEMYRPLLIGICIPAIPFFFALYQGWLLLRHVDENNAFSELSVEALKKIKYCAIVISAIYVALMPLVYIVAEKDDVPGAVLIGLAFTFAPIVIAVFAAVLQKLLQNAIDIKKENELTI